MDLTKHTELDYLAELLSAAKSAAPDTEWLLVGAMARDLLLYYGHGIPVARGTQDVDMGLAVQSWEHYEKVRRQLLQSKLFTVSSKRVHQLVFKDGTPLDIIPFGGVETTDRIIAWPPNGKSRMSVLGFSEAFQNAQEVVLPGKITVTVVNLSMLILLKIIAWSDRKHRRHGVDATDALLLLSNYLNCGNQKRLFTEHDDLLETSDFDYELAGAVMAGRDLRSMLPIKQSTDHCVISALTDIILPQIEAEHPGALLNQVPVSKMERFAQLLESLIQGLQSPRPDGGTHTCSHS